MQFIFVLFFGQAHFCHLSKSKSDTWDFARFFRYSFLKKKINGLFILSDKQHIGEDERNDTDKKNRLQVFPNFTLAPHAQYGIFHIFWLFLTDFSNLHVSGQIFFITSKSKKFP